MRNPLRKRLLREIKGDIGKYLVIFLMMVLFIGFVSGFLVADGSMLHAYHEGFTKYNIEDGHFTTTNAMNLAQKKSISEMGITLYDQFCVNASLNNGTTLRVYENRETVNKVCVMSGELPSGADEIALDRMYADNNQLTIGDTVSDGTNSWKVTGLVALPDYSCLFENNNDSMFDSLKFGVGILSKEGFDRIDEEQYVYTYAWKYNTEPADEVQEHDMAEAFMEDLSGEVGLEDFIPRYTNQAIQFTGDDMGGDMAMMVVLLYMVIVILAFVFALTTIDTIEKEASVIGTLRASGYTRGELVRHYMTPPILVTLVGAVIGNILGYTVFKGVCVDMYYGSYSLPTYITIWNAEAFLETTVIPVIIMLVINYVILWKNLRLEPLKFLRHDLTKKRKRKALRLNKHLPFFARFRLRVIFQNVGNYILIVVGVLFANLLLMFGLELPSVISHYQETLQDGLLCNYQYILTIPVGVVDDKHKLESMIALLNFENEVETENEDAEKFSAYTLDNVGTGGIVDEILFYGIEPDSRYIHLNLEDGEVYVSSAYADKYHIRPGDTIHLKERFEKDEYTFTVTGIYDYEGSLTVFMTRDYLNQVFDLGEDMFGGYFSDTEITDIDSTYIGSVIDFDSLTKISRQLEKSMGGNMKLINGFSITIFVVLIYLLSKVVIEKNAQSISMTKILGYNGSEIARLYIISTSIVVVASVLLSIPIENVLMASIWKLYVGQAMSGWLPYYLAPEVPVKMIVMGLLSYGVVVLLEVWKIKKVPMSMALKNVE